MLSLPLGMSGNGQPREIWVDHDGGWEDIAAIAMLLRSPDVKVMGIATTPGIADPKTAAARLGQLLDALQIKDIPLNPSFPNGAEILATGPLTRIAQMLAKGVEPKSLTWMGGSLKPKVEWNAGADAKATRAVFAARFALTLCPLDLTDEFPSDPGVVSATGTNVVAAIGKAYGERQRYFWDELAAASLVAPGLFKRETMNLGADKRGRIVKGSRPVSVLTQCDKPGFHALLAASLRF
jgi:inosine-uridine nucleoside N-ribohydrolase